ncbi:MAG: DMT family transporter [Oscillatoria sp. PMC 1068.18]|nr:DMT family transporter [Oscillatoria sp. PMC 1076.18]MEC4988748.1 DMT family transporter [Oscillatoria sp. PMC 1068.18]
MTDKLTVFSENFFANPKTKAIAALAIAVPVLSCVPILVKLDENEISPTAIIFHRLWIAAFILGLWNILLSIKHKSLNPDSQQFPDTSLTLGLFFGAGVCFTGTQVIWAWSLTQTSIANSALLHSFTPLFSISVGWLLFSQNFDRRFIIGAIVTIIGSALLGFDDFLYDVEKIKGDSLALFSAFLWAAYLLLVEQIRNQFNPITTLMFCCLFGTISLIPIVLISQEAIFPSSIISWLTLIALAVTTCLVMGISIYVLKWISSSFIAMAFLFNPVLAGIFAWIFFSEKLDLYNLLAFLISLLGISLALTSKSAMKKEA